MSKKELSMSQALMYLAIVIQLFAINYNLSKVSESLKNMNLLLTKISDKYER